jgi:exopolysaccharide biosynthesis polyprenyl glycosylphosphotransferase
MIHKREPFFLLMGDIFFLVISLWLALLLRNGELPSSKIFLDHLGPFSVLFVAWIIVFFIAGLYENHTVLLKSRLPAKVFNAQLVNTLLAVLFFYAIPYLTIAPKTVLAIYLVIFFVLALAWRIYGHRIFGVHGGRQKALLVGSGAEMKELFEEVNSNNRYDLTFISSIDLDNIEEVDFQEEILKRIYSEGIEIVAIDLHNKKVEPILPALYNLIFSHIRFIDMHKVYEDIFDKIPLSLIKYNWFLENISTAPKAVFDAIKRLFDIFISLILGTLSLVFYPFVYTAIKLDDGGVLMSYQTRVGQNSKPIHIAKFRTMTVANDEAQWGTANGAVKNIKNKVTRIGKILRKTRIDELPQIWNVLKGDLSFIGPRPEFPEPVKQYTTEIPYYNIRHIVKPGLSGWAQIYHERHPHHGLDIEETKNKLSYDLYYIKNRSLILDLKIALQTMKILFTFAGR